MEATEHTPGPWKWERVFVRNAAYNRLMGNNGNRIILRTKSPVGNDLNLIAQAPDLLAQVSEQEKEIINLKCKIEFWKRQDSDKQIKIIELRDKLHRNGFLND